MRMSANSVKNINGFRFLIPRPGSEGIGFGGQRPDWAQVHDVPDISELSAFST